MRSLAVVLALALAVVVAGALASRFSQHAEPSADEPCAATCDEDCEDEAPERGERCPPDCRSCHDCGCCAGAVARVERSTATVTRAPFAGRARFERVDSAHSPPDPRAPLRVPRAA